MSRVPPARPKDRYGDPGFRRFALAPGLIGAFVLLVGILLIGQEFYIAIRLLTAIFALIMAVFAVQAKQWWWVLPLIPVVVLWNPIVPIDLPEGFQLGAHYIAIVIMVLVGLRVKVPYEEESTGRRR